ncbi:hypothetical protein [Thioclava sp.]|uniref:hypothetical protein n=1 Tax=Thioclava sp. TaxID=1933450 RepID=UPI003AA7D88A
MAQLLIHIGYHKTATSWLQNKLFLPKHGYLPLANHQQVDAEIVRPHGLVFDPDVMRARIAKGIAQREPDQTPLISSEILSGHPFYGGRESDDFARRLHAIAPDARILITIRDQMRILPSVYMQYLSRGGVMPPDKFFAGTQEPGYSGFSPDHFAYHRLVGLYQTLFGAQNVHVMTQESLARDRDTTLDQLATFAGNTLWQGLGATMDKGGVGISQPQGAAWLLRRINHWQASTLNPQPPIAIATTPGGLYRVAGYLARRGPLAGSFARTKPVSDYVRATFAGQFADSNRALAAQVPGLDLSGYDGIG